MPFVALQPLAYQGHDLGVVHAMPGDVLVGFETWPPGAQTGLLEMRRAAYQGDTLATAAVVSPTVAAIRVDAPAAALDAEAAYVAAEAPAVDAPSVVGALDCPECERTEFANAAGLARHRTRAHGA